MHSVREIENPQHGHVRRCAILVASDRGVKATFSKLWLTFRYRIAVDRIVLDHIQCLGDHAVRLSQMIGTYEIEIVRRSVILGNVAKLAALKKSYRQVESRRTILAFVVAVGKEFENGMASSPE